MTNAYSSGLTPEALERIEQVRKKVLGLVAAARDQADCNYNTYLEHCIERDSQNRLQAVRHGVPVLIAGQMEARAVYFGAIAYELFLVSETVSQLEIVLEDAESEVAKQFPYNADVLRTLELDPNAIDLLHSLKQKWLARASGRAALQSPTFERAPQAFWQDLRIEFDKLDGADLQAVLKDNGWWDVRGGPGDPSARQTLTLSFGRLIRRGLAALGVYDRSVSADVWLDAIQRERANSAGTIDHLSFACADYCLELERCSTPEKTTKPQEPDIPPRAARMFHKQGDFWAICFGGDLITLKDARGLAYIAYLLQNPRRLVLAADLLAGFAGTDSLQLGSAVEKLDPTALARLKELADDLRYQLDQAIRNNDEGGQQTAREKLEQVAAELLASKGFGGRSRKFPDDREKVRKAVSNAIARSISAIRKHDPALGDHLVRNIDCGHFLIYSSDFTWQF